MASPHIICIIFLVFAFGFGNSNIDKDKEECANTLVGIATCLPYASRDAKAPTLDCCSGVRDVLKTNKKCLCLLVKDRNDPSLGLKFDPNRALGLPVTCHAPTNITECLSLLHLAPNSPDAKIFEDYVKNEKGSNTTAAPAKGTSNTTNGSSAKLTNEGGTQKSWLGVEMVSFIITSTMVHVLLNI